MEKIFKRLVALLSASTVAVTMGGCSNNSKNNNSSSPTSSLISKIEDSDVENTSSFVSSFVISSEINESKDVTTEIGNTSKEEDTSSRVEDTSSRPQTSSKEESSSKGPTSSKNETTSSNNQNSSNIVSSSSSQINTSSNTSSIVMPTRVTKENINDVDTFVYLANEFRKSSAPGSLIGGFSYYHNNEKFHTDGIKEFQFFMSILNYDYMETETLKSLFGDCTKEELKHYVSFLDTINYVPIGCNNYYDFEAYCLNGELAQILCDSARSLVETYNNQNVDELTTILYNYFLNENSTFRWKSVNAIVDCYLYGHYRRGHKYFEDRDFKDSMSFLYSDIDWSNNNFINEFYNKLHAKTKIYEK